jgi:hypothetical protein
MRKNVTLSAENQLIRRARERASREKRSLNDAFREWLRSYAGREAGGHRFRVLMEETSYARAGGRFSRCERGER